MSHTFASASMIALMGVGLVVGLCLLGEPAVAEQPAAPPSFPELLAAHGVDLDDLRRTAPPDWLGRADAERVPFVLPHHRWVQDDPRHLVALGANLLALARSASDPGKTETNDDEPPGLAALVTGFALQPRLPGFRGMPRPAVAAPEGATFDGLPGELADSVAGILAVLDAAASDVDRSWAGVDPDLLARALATEDVPRLLPGASVPWPDLGQVVAGPGWSRGDVDRASAALRLLEIEALARALAGRIQEIDPGPGPWRLETARGSVVLGGRGDDVHRCSDCVLILDLGGNDLYEGPVAVASPGRPAVAVVDLGGDDRYVASTARAAQGAGLGGVALLLDLAGDDRYQAGEQAQGYGLLGYGLLVDLDGDDHYVARGGAQGAGVFGAGLLVDAAGVDSYRVDGEGQGFGGPGAVGALVDLEGNDRYVAEADPAKAPGRSDVHSDHEVNASNAQGAGVGRRGELSDGHVWAGGVGVLVDLSGDDVYLAGNFSQASGFAHGTGLLLDAAGRDEARSVYFSQGSASHDGLALLLDLAGDDVRVLDHTSGAGQGYAWDAAVGLLVDAAGDDRYEAARLAMGSADRSSFGLLLELGGDDVYGVPEGAQGVRLLGATAGDPRDRTKEMVAIPKLRGTAHAADLGLFLDLGGVDVYPQVGGCAPADDTSWSCTRGRHRQGRTLEGLTPALGLGVDAELRVEVFELLRWLYGGVD